MKMKQIEMLKNSIAKAEEEKFIIFESGAKVEGVNFVLINEGSQKAYNVTTDGEKVTGCDCPHHMFRHVPCKHMIKIAMEKDLNLF